MTTESKTIPKEIRATVKAWFTSEYKGPADLLRKPEDAVGSMNYFNQDMRSCGWVLAGEADIVLRPIPEPQLIENKVESLRAKKTKVIADAQAEATEIEGQIQKLLAISYEPAGGAE